MCGPAVAMLQVYMCLSRIYIYIYGIYSHDYMQINVCVPRLPVLVLLVRIQFARGCDIFS